MLFNIAWRNVWRHPVRSAVVMVAIALGIWSGLFMMAFSWGITESRTRDVIDTQTSHLQLHPQQFEAGEEMQHFLPEAEALLSSLASRPEVKAATGRTLASGMLESTSGNFAVQIIGVDPEREAVMTQLRDRMIGGEYLAEDRRPVALIGEALAEEIGVIEEEPDSLGNQPLNLRKNLVIRFQGPDGEITSAKFKVGGVYKAQNVQLEESQVFVRQTDLQDMIGMPGGMQEIALLLNDIRQTDSTAASLAALHSDLAIKTWSDLAPELEFMSSSMDASMRVFMGIILLALAFGIVNTMLMAVMERTRELGMLMSVGMNKIRVFSMILLETVILTVVGAPIGLVAGWACTEYFGKQGINLGAFEKGMDEFGLASIVYTDLPNGYYGEIAAMVIITALLASIYPSLKALQLRPSEAVRAI